MSVPGEGYSVDLSRLDEVTARIRAFKGFVTDHLATLDDQAEELSASWSSEAAAAYDLAHREWLTGAKEVRDGLEVLESAARTAHGNYQAAVTANLRMLGL
ncbi:WXG100 family type VII secretion target [Nocardia sp. SYP-A9097]|uniref:WXG100 family type VII secretion target n=1 Tax=Nocardia sp. SYP-A9097 TaxID=2663237 RepID=UPI00132B63BF|nr:WXG100 family type VII secretion target [Nocardia sp. SYP-A9097]MRH89867.1 WXG100 family type VII secretion target [Nocardia sp. SYP-A9097]